jgi:hypothetical protein
MKYDFRFARKDRVLVLDYDEPRRTHPGIVLERWLTEDSELELQENYAVLVKRVDGEFQRCEFLGIDITPDPEYAS